MSEFNLSMEQQKWIVDVGAFHGDEGRRIKQSLKHEGDCPLLFIEADPLNYSEIETREGEKKMNFAIAPQDGWVDFHRYKPETGSILPLDLSKLEQYVDGHTGVKARQEDWQLHKKIRIPARRLDTICDEVGIQHIRYLKIDAQGYDLSVIQSLGDRLSIVDELVCEVQLPGAEIYKGGSSKQAVLDYMHAKGFYFIRQNYQTCGQELNMYFRRCDLLPGWQKEPLVSVLTPCFNSVKYLEQCIQSVLNQDYPHVEHIIQDGASKDGTLEILMKYEGRISWCSEKDQGQSDGLNRALQRCRGDIIGVLNADDEYEPGALSWAVENFFKNPDIGVIYGEQNNIDENGQILFQSKGPDPYSFERVFCCEDVIPAQAAFIRRSAMEQAGFYVDTSRQTCPDYEMWVRLGLKCRMKALPGFVARYRLHSGSEGQQADVIYKMVQSKIEVVKRVSSDGDVSMLIKKMAPKALAGIYEWSAWHFLPPHTINSPPKAWLQTARALFSYPHPRHAWRLFMRSFRLVGLPEPDLLYGWKVAKNRIRGFLRWLDHVILGGWIYKSWYLPNKMQKNSKDF